MNIKIGSGFDVHKFTDQRPLILGGVDIPYEKGLLGHSDADVLTHALMDAILGALGLGDIGKHFPDTDEKYEGADSLQLLSHVAGLMNEAGFYLGNADITVICQKPKIAAYISDMKENILAALGGRGEINIKGTTTEELGFCGRGEGIACQAVCLLIKK